MIKYNRIRSQMTNSYRILRFFAEFGHASVFFGQLNRIRPNLTNFERIYGDFDKYSPQNKLVCLEN